MGIAFTKYACDQQFGVSVTWTKYTNYMNIEATAHELSHNLGLNHDITGCECDNNTICVMANGDWGLGSDYSHCSINEYNDLIISNELQCLKEKLSVCVNKDEES
ncbi:disintegrin and metalloproteinase domain-containing protein 28-like protein [Leptotrombidium deliense]|uniref:Disintegrin and metalloproteinase domain-containing protein 28-like protein n=1 Tax=Leptotrombidium deliense TaxID=299467 RepID=A0A443S688_9ACAR|nr:disintegrin and metalloproteinase domain-containing protein 28-like protein [Leptotrombidium deliense]